MIYVSEATSTLWVANVAGALSILDALVDLRHDALSFVMNRSQRMLKTITNIYTNVMRVFLVNALAQVGFGKGL